MLDHLGKALGRFWLTLLRCCHSLTQTYAILSRTLVVECLSLSAIIGSIQLFASWL